MAQLYLTFKDNELTATIDGIATTDTIGLEGVAEFFGWDGYSKTIVFYQNPRKPYRVVCHMDEFSFTVPHEVLTTDGPLAIGAFGVTDDGKRKVSTLATVVVTKGMYDENAIESIEPTPTEYEQMLAFMNAYMEAEHLVDSVAEAAEQATEIAKEAITVEKNVAIEEAKAEISNASKAEKAEIETLSEEIIERAEGYADAAEMSSIEAANSVGRISSVEKRLSNIEQSITPSPFDVDDSVAYAKAVPVNALPYAEVNEIGGMTRKCANLIDTSKAIDTKTSGASIAINNDQITFTYGTASGDYFAFSCWVDVRPNTNYNLSCKSTSIDLFYIYTDKLFGTSVAQVWSSDGTFNSGDNDRLLVGFYSRGNLRTGASETISNIMLNEGLTALPYEPYYDGLISAPVTEVRSVGKNFVDMERFYELDGWVAAEGWQRKMKLFGVLPAGDYVFSAKDKGSIPSNQLYFYVQFRDDNGDWVSPEGTIIYQSGYTDVSRRRYHFSKNTEIALWVYYGTNNFEDVLNNYADVQIERGTAETEYEPYKSVSLPIPDAVRNLEGYGLGAGTIGNTIDFESGKYTRRVGIVDLGTLAWYYSDYDGKKIFSTYDPIGINSDTRNVVCTIRFTSYADIWLNGLDNVFFVNTTFIRGVFTQYTDAKTFKAAMSGVMLVYELAEPIVEDISDILPLDNYIEVFEGGAVYMENENKLDVPNKITYQIKEVT